MDKQAVAVFLKSVCPLEERVTLKEMKELGMSCRQRKRLASTQVLGCSDYKAWILRAYPGSSLSRYAIPIQGPESSVTHTRSDCDLTKKERKAVALHLSTLLPLSKCVKTEDLSCLVLSKRLIGRLVCFQPKVNIKRNDTAHLWVCRAIAGKANIVKPTFPVAHGSVALNVVHSNVTASSTSVQTDVIDNISSTNMKSGKSSISVDLLPTKPKHAVVLGEHFGTLVSPSIDRGTTESQIVNQTTRVKGSKHALAKSKHLFTSVSSPVDRGTTEYEDVKQASEVGSGRSHNSHIILPVMSKLKQNLGKRSSVSVSPSIDRRTTEHCSVRQSGNIRPSKAWFDKLRNCKTISDAVSIAKDISFAYYPKKTPVTESTKVAKLVTSRAYGRRGIKQCVARPFSGRCNAPVINAKVVNFYGSNPFAQAVNGFRKRVQPRTLTTRGYDSDISDDRKQVTTCTNSGYHSEGDHQMMAQLGGQGVKPYGHVKSVDIKTQLTADSKAKALHKKQLQGKESKYPGLGYSAGIGNLKRDSRADAPDGNGGKSIKVPLRALFVSSGFHSKDTSRVSELGATKSDTVTVSSKLKARGLKKKQKKSKNQKIKADSDRVGHAMRTVKKGVTAITDSGVALRELAGTIAAQSNYVSKAVTTIKQLHVAHSRNVRDLELRDENLRNLREKPLLDKLLFSVVEYEVGGVCISTFTLMWQSLADVSVRYELAPDNRYSATAISFNAILDISKSRSGDHSLPMYDKAAFAEFLLYKFGASGGASRLLEEYNKDCTIIFSGLKNVVIKAGTERPDQNMFMSGVRSIATARRVVALGYDNFKSKCCGYNYWLTMKFDCGQLRPTGVPASFNMFTQDYSQDLGLLFSRIPRADCSYDDMRARFSDIAIVKDMYPLAQPALVGENRGTDILCPQDPLSSFLLKCGLGERTLT